MYADGVQLTSSPVVLHVVPPHCIGALIPLSDGTCGCGESVWGSAFPLIPSLNCSTSINVYGLIGGVLAAGFLAFLIGMVLWSQARDDSWRIDVSSLVFPATEEIIGKGSFGVVLRATYRGSRVAVKKGKPPAAAAKASLRPQSLDVADRPAASIGGEPKAGESQLLK